MCIIYYYSISRKLNVYYLLLFNLVLFKKGKITYLAGNCCYFLSVATTGSLSYYLAAPLQPAVNGQIHTSI